VLEAMACGCPVICSNVSSLPEVTGDAALLVDPSDMAGLACEMERVLTDPHLRQGLRERGLTQAAKFTWDRTARETVAVYKKVVQGQSWKFDVHEHRTSNSEPEPKPRPL